MSLHQLDPEDEKKLQDLKDKKNDLYVFKISLNSKKQIVLVVHTC